MDFGQPKTFDRLEFTIENPGYKRGQGKKFELQIREADSTWRTVYQGQVFGKVYAKAFAPVTAQQVRLCINAVVRQFDLYQQAN